MKAAVVNGVGTGFEIEDLVISEPIGREVLVTVKASGLCHTDLTIANHDLGFPRPIVLGHEIAGIVTAVGPDVTDFAPGDHVVACLLQACGSCEVCMSGKPFSCPNPQVVNRPEGAPARLYRQDGTPVATFSALGGFAEQALVHQNQLVKVPHTLPWPVAAIMGCGVVTGAGSALNTADIQPSDTVVVVGAGGVGLNAISGARIAGAAKIIVVDIDDAKLEKSRNFGATHTVNSGTQDAVAAVHELTGGGAKHVFDFVGVSAVAQQNLEMLGTNGTLYIIGAADPTASVTVGPFASLVLKQVRVQGVNLGSSNFKREIPFYADLYAQGRMNLDDLISREISLDDINDGYQMLKEPGTTRVVITF